jgi:hypothetical protein
VQRGTKSTEETKELIIDPETENSVESGKQEIQQTPEKTEDEKPDTLPEYEEPEEMKPPVDNTPKTGDIKDGMVYVEGFGWLPDEGAGSGTNADDMYENGNKVGIMD